MNYKDYITTIPNYPIDGIIFRDITSLLGNGKVFNAAIEEMYNFAKKQKAEIVCGPESRGFIFGCPIANKLSVGFVPVRKKGKLPRETIKYEYKLEYGSNTLEMHVDSIKKGQRVLITDDLLATGGTIEAAIKLIEQLGGIVVGLVFLIELKDLKGRERLKSYPILTLMEY
jgi:adenine phosphoribosyltransferase